MKRQNKSLLDLIICFAPFPHLPSANFQLKWSERNESLSSYLVLVNATGVKIEMITIWMPGSSLALLSWGRICTPFLWMKISQRGREHGFEMDVKVNNNVWEADRCSYHQGNKIFMMDLGLCYRNIKAHLVSEELKYYENNPSIF